MALDKIPVVICPGFGNDAIDYLNPLNRGEEFSFVTALAKRGFNPDLIQVLPLKRYEWIRVAGGLKMFGNRALGWRVVGPSRFGRWTMECGTN